MKRIIYLMIIIIPFFISFTVNANPSVSFTVTSIENKTVLTPNINSEVSHYKWSITGKKDAYNSETDWIPYADRADHISILEPGIYFVTITGRNTTTELSSKFTNQIKVNVEEEYVEPSKEALAEESIGSRIINNMPEPLRSFFQGRSDFELLLIILVTLLLIGIATRRKKVNKYIKLERIKNE